MAIKGYVVRFLDGETACEVTPDSLTSAVRAVRELPAYDASICRVLADGTEERLPSYEEALAEIERLRVIEALNVGAIDASLVRLGAVTGAIGPMPRHDARCLIHDGAGCSFEAGCDAGRALMPPADPLAALEAAERRLLEAGEWTLAEPDRYGGERWARGSQNECTMVAVSMARRLAAKGGA